MTPEAQRIAIAEACGVIECDNWHSFIAGASMMKNDESCGHGNCVPIGMLPDYLNDLNAMHEAEEHCDPEAFADQLARVCLFYDCDLTQPRHVGEGDLHEDFACAHATAAQRAEAFLRTIGKWTES